MKLIVSKWFYDFLLQVTLKFLEVLFRIILFFLPLGVFMTILQFRGKVSKTSNLSAFTTDNSVWQHVFPGFILVAIDPEQFKTSLKGLNNKFQNWVNINKYSLATLFILIFLALIILGAKI